MDLWALPLFGDRKPFPLVKTPFSELNATFSPDGRWLAFQSNETGQSQIYVQSFPGAGGTVMVSKDGGVQPCGAATEKSCSFSRSDAKMMAAAIDTAGQFEAGFRRALQRLDEHESRVYRVGITPSRKTGNVFSST